MIAITKNTISKITLILCLSNGLVNTIITMEQPVIIKTPPHVIYSIVLSNLIDRKITAIIDYTDPNNCRQKINYTLNSGCGTTIPIISKEKFTVNYGIKTPCYKDKKSPYFTHRGSFNCWENNTNVITVMTKNNALSFSTYDSRIWYDQFKILCPCQEKKVLEKKDVSFTRI